MSQQEETAVVQNEDVEQETLKNEVTFVESYVKIGHEVGVISQCRILLVRDDSSVQRVVRRMLLRMASQG